MIKKIALFNKTIYSLLSFTLLTTAITGCGKSANKATETLKSDVSTVLDESKEISKDYIFKQTDYDGILKKGEVVQFIDYTGDRGRAVALDKDNKFRCISVNKDGSDVQSFDIPIDSDEASQILCAIDKDGNLYAYYASTKPYLKKFDTSGTEILSRTLEFNVYDMYWIENYGLVLNTSQGIMSFNDQDNFSVVIDSKDIKSKFNTDLIRLNKGSKHQLFATIEDSNGNSSLSKLNLDNKTFGKIGTACSDKHYSFYSGNKGYDLYVYYYYGILGYDYESDKLTKLIDIDDSDIDRMSLLDMVFISDTEIFALTTNIDGEQSFSSFSKVKPEDVPDKTQLTLGGAWFTADVYQAAIAFNKTSDKYKVKVIDYSDSYPESELDDVINAFNQDILAGNTPDIMCFSSFFAPNIESYASKGVLLDLSSAFDKGGVLQDVHILPNIFEMMKTDGKVYSVIPSFTYNTLLMKESAASNKTSISIKEYDELNVNGFRDGYTFIDTSIQSAGTKFIDWQSKKCNLNTPEFVEILKYAQKIEESTKKKNDTEEIEIVDEPLTIAGNGTICNQDIYGFNSFADLEQNTLKDNAAIIGFPNNSGETTTMITPFNLLCISGSTKSSEGALEFIKNYCINPSINNGAPFPSYKSLFETYMKKATEPPASEDDATVCINGHEVKLDPLSTDEAQKLYDSILSCKAMHRIDPQLEIFINEETSALFAGQKSAEEVADVLNNRISIYINEQ